MTSDVPTATQPKSSEKDLVARLADAGEDALQRLVDLPGGQRALTAFNDLRARVDELGKKVRGIDALEARVTKLEKEVAALKKPKAATRSSTARSSAKRPPASS
jgi:outer membrane murein-binding lipoprotein Lpp